CSSRSSASTAGAAASGEHCLSVAPGRAARRRPGSLAACTPAPTIDRAVMATARAHSGTTQAAIRALFDDSVHTKQVFLQENASALEQAIDLVAVAVAAGHKIL